MAMVIGPTPPGTGVIQARAFGRGREFDVAGEFPVSKAVDSDVDDDRAITNPYTWDVGGFSYSGDHQIGALHFAAQIARSRVTYRDRGTRQQQLQRHRPADDVRCARPPRRAAR